MFTCSKFRSAALAAWAVMIVVSSSSRAQTEGAPPTPKELVRQAVENEGASDTGPGLHFMFRDIKQSPHLSQTKLIVETRDATAGMLIAQNGQPLSPNEQQAEEARLASYVNQPAELSKKRKQEKEDSERTVRILKALPDALLFEPEGMVNASAGIGRIGHQLVRLKFRPNPAYQPPTRVEQVLTGMQGHVLIDPQAKRLAQIDGTLDKEVGFGWGILGHLDRGGHFVVEQAEVGNNQWEVTRMVLNFTGKILLVKRLTIHESEEFSDFRIVPSDLSFAQGVELLKKVKDKSAEGPKSEPSTSRAQPIERGHTHEKVQTREALCCER